MNTKPIGTIKPGGEPKITIRVIGKCNFHCPSCSTGSHPKRPGILRFKDFQKIIDCLQKEKFKGVVNLSGGEPFLHRELPAMALAVAYALPQSTIVVFTNGTWIGKPWWGNKLSKLLSRPNILVRMSIDRPHILGALRGAGRTSSKKNIHQVEMETFARGRKFINKCLACKAKPGKNFDFAFKGTRQDADKYLTPIGKFPVYTIHFEKNPASRPKKYGYFGIDLDAEGHPQVFPTLGHILRNQPLGGLEKLSHALAVNRNFLSKKKG